MAPIAGIIILGFFGTIIIGSICGIVVAFKIGALRQRVDGWEKALKALKGELSPDKPLVQPAPPKQETPPANPPAPTSIKDDLHNKSKDQVEPLAAHSSSNDDPLTTLHSPTPGTATFIKPSRTEMPPSPSNEAESIRNPSPVKPSAPKPNNKHENHKEDTTNDAKNTKKGEEKRSWERFLGQGVLVWAGLGILFLGLVLLLTHGIRSGWFTDVFTPLRKVLLVGSVGTVITLIGLRHLHKRVNLFSQSLVGGGIAIAQLAVYAAIKPQIMWADTALLGTLPATIILSLLTAGGIFWSIHKNAPLLHLVALIGGFLVPVFTAESAGSFHMLCLYLVILDLGVLLGSWYRHWRWHDLVAYTGTALLLSLALLRPEGSSLSPNEVVPWLLVFHGMFSTLPFIDHWRRRTKVNVARFAMAIGTIAFTTMHLQRMLVDEHSLGLGLTLLALAGFESILALITRARCGADSLMRAGFVSAIASLVALSLVHLLPTDLLATGWAVEAVILLLMGRFMASPWLKIAGYLLLVPIGIRTITNLPADPGTIIPWCDLHVLALAIPFITGMVLTIIDGPSKECDKSDLYVRLSNDLKIIIGYVAPLGLMAVVGFDFHTAIQRGLWEGNPALSLPTISGLFVLTMWLFRLIPPWNRLPGKHFIIGGLAFAASIPLIQAYLKETIGWPIIGLRLPVTLILVGTAYETLRKVWTEPKELLNLRRVTVLAIIAAIAFDVAQAVPSESFRLCWATYVLAISSLIFQVWDLRNNRWNALPNLLWAAAFFCFIKGHYDLQGAYTPFFNAYVPAMALLMTVPALYLRWKDHPKTIKQAPGIMLAVVVFTIITWEIPTGLYRLGYGDAATMSLTICWGLGALTTLAVGIVRNYPTLRLIGLCSFCLPVGKLLIVDMAQSGSITRIIAAMATGLLLIIGSWFYTWLERRYAADSKKTMSNNSES